MRLKGRRRSHSTQAQSTASHCRLTSPKGVTVHGYAVRPPLTGCQTTSRPRDRFSRYLKWTDIFRTTLVFRNKSGCFSSLTGRAMVQAVSRLLLIEEAWVRFKFSPRESSDGQNDSGAGLPCQNNSHNSPHSFSSTHRS